MRSACLGAVLVLAVAAGCDRERTSAPGLDAGMPDAAETGVTPPAAPTMTPCPEGWSEVELGDRGLVACEPWPEGGPGECGDGEARLPGAAGCGPVGPPCPAGDFAEDLPTDREVVYIAGTPGTGGDGTRERPFHTLGDAFAASTGEEIFALGKGTHEVIATFPEDVTFWGACAAETRIEPGFLAEGTGTITAREGARLVVRNVRVRGPTPGFLAIESARIEAENVIVEDTGISAIWAYGGGSFVGRNVVVRDTRGTRDGFARAFAVQEDGRIEVYGGLVERAGEIAAFAVDSPSALILHDVAIRETRPMDPGGGWGRAVDVGPGATAELVRVAIEGNLEYGVFAGGAGTSVTIRDSVVRRTRSRSNDGEAGRGLSVQGGGELVVERVLVDDNREIGIYGSGEGTVVTLRDVVVRRTAPRAADDIGGRGVQVQWGARLDAERVALEDNVGFGVLLYDVGTTARLVDLAVRDTTSDPVDGLGRGLNAFGGVVLEIDRAELSRNTDIGLFLQDEGTMATLRDLVVVGTRPLEDGTSGRGASIQGGAAVSGERVRLLDNVEVGMHVSGSTVSLADCRIERTAEQPCAETTCAGRGSGLGVTSIGGSQVRLSEFVIADNALAGLFLATGGSVDLEDGEVARHPIGIHIGGEEVDFERDLRDVAFVDNDRNVDATVQPVPDPSPPGDPEL